MISSTQLMHFVFIIVPFAGFFVLALIDYFLTRSILRLLRETAPDTEKGLSVRTGLPLIDNMFWVRPRKFAKFALSNPSLGDPRLARRLAQYRRAHQVAIGFAIYFAILFIFLFVLFVRH